MNDQVQQRPPREWVELITVSNPALPVVVRVQVTAEGRPLYSMEVGVLRDERILRHIPIFTQPDGTVAPFETAILMTMINQAHQAIAVDARRKAEAWRANQGNREARPGRGNSGPAAPDRGRGKDASREERGRPDRQERQVRRGRRDQEERSW